MTEIAKLTKKQIKKEIEKLWTATLATVTSVDYEQNLCTVSINGDIILRDLPIMYPSTSAGTLMMALSEGDQVLVLFGKYNIREQLARDEVNEQTLFSINNGVVIPGGFSSPPYVLQDNEIVIRHSSGAGMKFSGDGMIRIVAKDFDVLDMNLGAEL